MYELMRVEREYTQVLADLCMPLTNGETSTIYYVSPYTGRRESRMFGDTPDDIFGYRARALSQLHVPEIEAQLFDLATEHVDIRANQAWKLF
jgi:hypothetical protein